MQQPAAVSGRDATATNERDIKMRLLPNAALFVLSAVVVMAFANTADAQQVTNNMTCSQAQQIYAAQGSIRTRLRSGQVVNLYGGVPTSQRRQLNCMRSTRMPKMVETSDNGRCPISYSCR